MILLMIMQSSQIVQIVTSYFSLNNGSKLRKLNAVMHVARVTNKNNCALNGFKQLSEEQKKQYDTELNLSIKMERISL